MLFNVDKVQKHKWCSNRFPTARVRSLPLNCGSQFLATCRIKQTKGLSMSQKMTPGYRSLYFWDLVLFHCTLETLCAWVSARIFIFYFYFYILLQTIRRQMFWTCPFMICSISTVFEIPGGLLDNFFLYVLGCPSSECHDFMIMIFFVCNLRAWVPRRLNKKMTLRLWRLHRPETHGTSLCFRDAHWVISDNALNRSCLLCYFMSLWCPAASLKRWNYVYDVCVLQKHMTRLYVFGVPINGAATIWIRLKLCRWESNFCIHLFSVLWLLRSDAMWAHVNTLIHVYIFT